MKKSILAVLAIAALSGNVALANSPLQDKPTSKTTTVKKTMPSSKAATKSTKTVHKKHVKNS